MKKWSWFMIFLIIGGCASLYVLEERNTVTFQATIEEIHGNRAIVIDQTGGRIWVDLSVNRFVTFQVGDEVVVGHDGAMQESDPAQIGTLSVELVEERKR